MPLSPMSKSPRAADASMLVKPTWMKRGVRSRPSASSAAMSTSKPTTRVGVGGIGFDKRRAAFGVAAPSQLGRLRRGVRGNERRRAHTHDGARTRARDDSRSPLRDPSMEEK